MNDDLKISLIEKISDTDDCHNFLEGVLPAYLILYGYDEAIKACISIVGEKF